MKKADLRREKIFGEVSRNGFVKTENLSKILNVSVATIKRDLILLEKEGKIVRTRGGAFSKSTSTNLPQFDSRIKSNKAAKEVIAMRAAKMIEENDVVFLDSGSTILAIIKYITKKNVTIFTNSIPVITEVMNSAEELDVNVIPGKVLKGHMTISGLAAINEIDELFFDKVFLSATYLNYEYGIVGEDYFNKAIKQKLVKRSGKKILCADSSKLKGWKMMNCVPYSDIDCWITDRYLENDLTKTIETFGVEILREG